MKLLEENDYLIRIEKCHKGVQMFLPERRIAPYSVKLVKKYIINKSQLFSNDYSTLETRNVLRCVDIPPYATKCAIYLDMRHQCIKFRYNTRVVKVEDKFGLENVFGILPKLDDDTEIKSDLLFLGLFGQISPREIEQGRILEGYMKLKPYLELIGE